MVAERRVASGVDPCFVVDEAMNGLIRVAKNKQSPPPHDAFPFIMLPCHTESDSPRCSGFTFGLGKDRSHTRDFQLDRCKTHTKVTNTCHSLISHTTSKLKIPIFVHLLDTFHNLGNQSYTNAWNVPLRFFKCQAEISQCLSCLIVRYSQRKLCIITRQDHSRCAQTSNVAATHIV
jgi:hypothetical protein